MTELLKFTPVSAIQSLEDEIFSFVGWVERSGFQRRSRSTHQKDRSAKN